MHHAVFDNFECWSGEVPAGSRANFLGVITSDAFTTFLPQHAKARRVETHYPPPCEDFIQYIDVLEAVLRAQESFTMIELGAGYGRWLVNAAAAMRQTRGLPCHLVGIEAEPTHFQWMREHFMTNRFDPDDHDLRQVAVSAHAGESEFLIGDPGDCYSQSLAGVRASASGSTALTTTAVEAITLAELLAPFDAVDLIHVDIQGAEADVIEPAMESLAATTRMVHIGTHAHDIEDRLRRMFGESGWQSVHDYACNGERQTPWGPIAFEDGIQSWRNPAL